MIVYTPLWETMKKKGITTYALIYSKVSVENNSFNTGNIKINLKDLTDDQ